MPDTSLHGLIRPDVDPLPRYNSGMSPARFREVYGIEVRAKLDSNENPLGPCPGAIEVIRDLASMAGRYPDAGTASLCRAIAERSGVTAERVITGNGSEDLIDAIYHAVLQAGDRVLTICPSFGLHELNARACGAEVTKVPFPADWAYPVDGLIAELARPTKVLIFSTPSNPAGPALTEGELRRLLAAVPQGTLVVYDEAYTEYLPPELRFDVAGILTETGLDWVILRTFSKAWGLAGARVGFGIASHVDLIGAIMKVRTPFAVNAFAAAAAEAALKDLDHMQRGVDLSIAERAKIRAGLVALGHEVAPSAGNFVFFNTGEKATDFAERLRGQGVLIKAWLEEPYTNWARVSTGTAEETEVFLQAVAAIARK